MAHQATSESGHGVEISADRVRLAGDLVLSPDARAVVVFAHGSGSGRFSPRNRAVAGVLNQAGLATLLLDLLTAGEEAVDLRTRHLRFDLALLGRRVIATIDWPSEQPPDSYAARPRSASNGRKRGPRAGGGATARDPWAHSRPSVS